MPASPSVLSGLIQSRMASNFEELIHYNPLRGKDISYFVEYCTGFGSGIAVGSPLINFVTEDTGLKGTPAVAGAGTGTGIVVDSDFFTEQIYTKVRAALLARFPAPRTTRNIPWPPTTIGNGLVLKAVADAIAVSVKNHYATVWILASAHPAIYIGSGTISDGDFSGLSSSLVKTQIDTFAPRLANSSFPGGPFFPEMAQAVADAYVLTIHTKSTGTVTITGSCSPGPGQVCGLPGTGSGTGTAT